MLVFEWTQGILYDYARRSQVKPAVSCWDYPLKQGCDLGMKCFGRHQRGTINNNIRWVTNDGSSKLKSSIRTYVGGLEGKRRHSSGNVSGSGAHRERIQQTLRCCVLVQWLERMYTVSTGFVRSRQELCWKKPDVPLLSNLLGDIECFMIKIT